MQAAFLVGQLEHLPEITERRGDIMRRYARKLEPLVARGAIGRPRVPSHCVPNHHMVAILAADIDERTALIAHLRQAGILAVFHYVPLHSSPFARSIGVPQTALPITEDISDRLVRLPIYFDLSDREVEEIADVVLDFYRIRHAA